MARVTQTRKHQTERLSLVGSWSPDERDFLLIPQNRWQLDDATWIEASLNVFGGKSSTMFGAFDRNDDVLLTFRRSYCE